MCERGMTQEMEGDMNTLGTVKMAFPPGHYYSPDVDPADLARRSERIWRPGGAMAGIDLRESEQLRLLPLLAPYVAQIAWAVEGGADERRYFYANGMFPVLDAEVLFAVLGHFKPRRMIEVGSGFSSLVAAEANCRLLDGKMQLTCVDPYPRPFIEQGVDGLHRLVQSRIEDQDIALFDELDAGDVLFIDSSHVVKTAGDVTHLFFEVLPRLRPGVLVHLHDIFLPDEYPKAWLLEEGRSWNEQYLLRAFLMWNREWQVLWSAHYMVTRHTPTVQEVFPRCPALGTGGSFWMRRC